jgi:hypothetical protein
VSNAISRRNLLIGAGALFASGCAATYPSKPAQNQTRTFYDLNATVRVIGTPVFEGPEYSATSYCDLGEAVRPIVSKGARVLAFGELHARNAGEPSTINAFVHCIMPLLHEEFYDDGIFEALPFGSRADAEIDQYKKTGLMGPVLAEWLSHHPDAAAIREMLEVVRKYGSNLFGSNCLDLADFREKKNDEAELQSMITRHTIALMRKLLGEGRKIFNVGGAAHNDFTLKEGNEEINFGRRFREELGDQFIQIDLYQKDMLEIFIREDDRAELYIDVKDWRKWIPQSGANRLHYHSGPDKGREVIIF